MSLWNKHAIFEKNSILLLIGVLIVISIGGLVEIAPLEGRKRLAPHRIESGIIY